MGIGSAASGVIKDQTLPFFLFTILDKLTHFLMLLTRGLPIALSIMAIFKNRMGGDSREREKKILPGVA